jgi:hypothetical protein
VILILWTSPASEPQNSGRRERERTPYQQHWNRTRATPKKTRSVSHAHGRADKKNPLGRAGMMQQTKGCYLCFSALFSRLSPAFWTSLPAPAIVLHPAMTASASTAATSLMYMTDSFRKEARKRGQKTTRNRREQRQHALPRQGGSAGGVRVAALRVRNVAGTLWPVSQTDSECTVGKTLQRSVCFSSWALPHPRDTQDSTQWSFSGMRQAGLISVLLPVIAIAVCGSLSWAEDLGANGHRKVLAESAGGSALRACNQTNCGTVLAVRHAGLDESPPPTQVQGALSRQPPFARYDPLVAPVTQPSFLVQKHTDTWVIEVRRRDGTIQSIEQTYPALFQVGDEVLIEGDRVRAPD